MLDGQIYAALQQQLLRLAPLRGISARRVMLRYQPSQQGRPDDATIWMHKITDRRLATSTTYDRSAGFIREREEVAMATTIQFSITQPSAERPGDLTHGDALKAVAGALQSRAFLVALRPLGLSVLRVTDVRNSYINNDKGQNEENPSFDLVVKHSDVRLDGVPEVTRYEFNLIRVPDLAA